MPELVVSGSGTNSAMPPPPAAFQPLLKILKRPTAGLVLPGPASPSSADTSKSYAEREAQYQAARQRIFNDSPRQSTAEGRFTDTERKAATEPKPPAPTDTANVKIIRAPRGPSPDTTSASSATSKPSRGFTHKRGVRSTTRG
ncbi:hypothetical protein DAEQUDRAFT_734046 [Daedalea quercina L-15889]|uniref:SUZ domain-containing protein n=1 Tax=Daedalea quercina L-15889 TaxID=1314783 RepID=A0A165KKA5_9APHY|nr:hypothetical protein DAEQUDRAFT_734046 [Daedalea quercina L-15889]